MCFLKEGRGSRAPYHDYEVIVTINHHCQSTQVRKRKKSAEREVVVQLCCVSVVGCCCCTTGMLHNYDKVSRMPSNWFE
jgi:hypothetical protein